MEVTIRAEKRADVTAIRAVHRAAFETSMEANLVDTLRDTARPLISLVAEQAKEVVGHILFSPATIPDHTELRLMGLAPMAVMPAQQRKGIGSALVRSGLDEARRMTVDAVVVLGHPSYYPRFGFQPSIRFGIRSSYDVPDEAFMAIELRPGSLTGVNGVVYYHEAFTD
jgi:putative acetyltransferase